jgi:hypothetical protein
LSNVFYNNIYLFINKRSTSRAASYSGLTDKIGQDWRQHQQQRQILHVGMNKTRALGEHMALPAGSKFAFKAVLGTLYVNPDAIVERRNDPAISG